MKILVLGGGTSPERPISLRSAAAVAKGLQAAGFEVEQADTAQGFSVLDEADGSTIVFPILHGEGGEDGSIQSELEKRGIAYLGTRTEASVVCFDKYLAREALIKAGVPVAEGDHVTIETYATSSLRHKPHVIKAVGGGSSLGTLIVRTPTTFDTARLSEVFSVSDRAVIEELVEGTEITIPIFDNSALPVIEIQPPVAGEFDYENKYNGRTQEICPPVSIDQSLQEKAQRVGEKVHSTLGARHLSRVDMIVRPNGELVVLEINTMPGMTDQSLYPKAAAVAGIIFPDLMKRFVELIMRDYKLLKV